MAYIEITTIQGTAPFEIYVCDFTYTYCEYVTTISNIVYIPYSFELPITFYNVTDLIIKIIDSNGCVSFQNKICPSPTPTITPTVTPSPTPI
jgi:hypothetical protein